MQSHAVEASTNVKKEAGECTDPSFNGHPHGNLQDAVKVSSSSDKSDSDDTEDRDDDSVENISKQLVLYNPEANGTSDIVSAPQPIRCHLPFGKPSAPNMPPRVLPSVGAFTVQCAKCFKWRLIPTKEKYEEIREHILEQPFYCETAREWRPNISCDDEADIFQDGSRLWAIDKPNIAQPPPGWQRLLRIRGEGSTKFADVYYAAPSGKRLRSMVEVQKYLMEHPEYTRDGITLSQFSFQTPKPLQENYVRKRPARITTSCDNAKPFESGGVNRLACTGPYNTTVPQLGRLALPPPPSFEDPVSSPFERPAKKQATRRLSKQMYGSDPAHSPGKTNIEEPGQSSNTGI